MGKVYMFLANGFEESEAIVPADLLKRAGADVVLVSTEAELTVTGSRGFTITADIQLEEVRKEEIDCIILPGGLNGTLSLGANKRILGLIEYAASRGIYIAAICAAPSILGKMRLLDGRNVAVYPGFEESMKHANITGKKCEHDDIFITAEGMGVSFEFGFKIIEVLFGYEKADEIRNEVRYSK